MQYPPVSALGSGNPEHQMAVTKPTLVETLKTFQESIANPYILSNGRVKHNKSGPVIRTQFLKERKRPGGNLVEVC